MNNQITNLLTKSSPDFQDLTNKLQICIAEALPTSKEAPPHYLRLMTSIVDSVESIRSQISKNVSAIINSPSTTALKLSDTEMKLWITSIEEKERIAILPDVSHKEYVDFINNLDCCLSTWKTWNWKVPDFYTDIDYNELLKTITTKTDIPRAPLTINNMLYWLLLQWIKTTPSRVEIESFADIFVRTYFYRLIDEHKIGQKLVLIIKHTYDEVLDLIRIIPVDLQFNYLIEAKILQYIIHGINTDLESADSTTNFIAIAGFEKIWNEAFPSTKLILHESLSKRACSLYLTRIQKAFEDLLIETDTAKLHINLLYIMRSSFKIMYTFDRNHYLIRLFNIFSHNWRIILEKCKRGTWAENIAMLDEHWLFYNEMKDAIANSPQMVKQSLASLSFFQAFERSCLEESTDWKVVASTTVIAALPATLESWTADPIMSRYIRRFMRFYIGEVLEPLLHTRRDNRLEASFENIVNMRNELSKIDGHERWIEFLDIFINQLSDYIYKATANNDKYSIFNNTIGLIDGLSKTLIRRN